MAFKIHELVFNRDGSPLEIKARKYQDELLPLFAESPEWRALTEDAPSAIYSPSRRTESRCSTVP